MVVLNKIVTGDCLAVLPRYPDVSMNLIVTSPPYAEKRGALSSDKYVSWFMPRAAEFWRVLSPTGSFILNIKEGARDGERQLYVLDLVRALKEQGWLWTEEYIWHKQNSSPGKWPNRFRDAWEHCYHFTKQRDFYMDQKAVMVPIGDWAKSRLANLSKKDKRREDSQVGSGFGKNVSNWATRDMVYPTNVLSLATECGNKKHAAAYPISLPTWFIKLFSRPDDVVLDPFIGSGTTAVAAKQLGRQFLGIEINDAFCAVARERLKST